MTVVDFRGGGFDGIRREDAQGSGHPDYGQHGYGMQGQPADQDWLADEDWVDGRLASRHGEVPLTARDTLGGRVARLGHYLGAVLSVLLMLSLGIWGYRLVMRDVSGIPVIRAMEGEARTAPDDPGGELSDRTGLAVNAVAGGVAAKPADKVAIAPGATALEAQDVAMGQLGATARAPLPVEEQAVPADEAPVIALTDAQVAARTAEEAKALAAANQAAAEAEAAATVASDAPAAEAPVNEAVTDLAGAQTQDAAITTALAEAGAGVAQSARPAPRPPRVMAVASTVATDAVAAPLTEAPLADLPVADSAAAPAAVTPAAAAPAAPVVAEAPAPAMVQPKSGSPLVQIGAFDSDAIAQAEWSRVSGRYGDLFAGKSPVVVKHQAGGRTFWRLRVAGFDGRDDARKFCAKLIEAGTDCIPATAK